MSTKPLTVGSLYSGIGGFDLGLQWAGMETRWQVEKDAFCRQVLAKHWPDVARYEVDTDVGKHNLEPVDLICGGFPCQPFSTAGKQGGAADDRNRWPEMRRIIAELQPRWVVGENVAGLINVYLDRVLADLEVEGYEAWTVVLPAAAVNAPHRRDRVFVLAYAAFGDHAGQYGERGIGRQAHGSERQGLRHRTADAGTVPTPVGYSESGRGQVRESVSAQRQSHITDVDRSSEAMGYPTGEGLPNWAGGEMGQPSPLTEFERPSGREVERNFCGVSHGVSRRVDRLKSLGNAVVPQLIYLIGRYINEVERSLAG